MSLLFFAVISEKVSSIFARVGFARGFLFWRVCGWMGETEGPAGSVHVKQAPALPSALPSKATPRHATPHHTARLPLFKAHYIVFSLASTAWLPPSLDTSSSRRTFPSIQDPPPPLTLALFNKSTPNPMLGQVQQRHSSNLRQSNLSPLRTALSSLLPLPLFHLVRRSARFTFYRL